MTKRETLSLFIKLIGVYFFIEIIPSLVYVLYNILNIQDSQQFWVGIASVAFTFMVAFGWIIFCVVIIRKSDAVARLILREDKEIAVKPIIGLSFSECQALGYNFIGAALVAQSLPQIVEFVGMINLEKYIDPLARQKDVFRNTVPRMLGIATQLGIGILLFAKSNYIVELWQRIQVRK